jgi:hypothetical protein
MGALALIPNGAPPPARAALVDLNKRITNAEAKLDRLVQNLDRLRSELSRADSAKGELEFLITEDASSLVGKMKAGVSWALSNLGSPRAMTLVAQLSESRIQHEIGAAIHSCNVANIPIASGGCWRVQRRRIGWWRRRRPYSYRRPRSRRGWGLQQSCSVTLSCYFYT